MLLLLKRHSRLFLRKISGIIPLICCKRIVLDFENAVADSIKKITVVAHHQNRARIGFEIAFQPFHRLKIQMVCRLVQNQKIRLLQQQLGKAKSGMLAAGEHSHAFLIIRRGKSHAIQYLFDLCVHIIAVRRIYNSGELRMTFQKHMVVRTLRHLTLQTLHLVHRVQNGTKRVFHFSIYRACGVQHAVLLQITYRRPVRQRHDSVIRVQLTRDDLDERGFACAVLANNSGAVLCVQHAADVPETQLSSKIFLNVLYR